MDPAVNLQDGVTAYRAGDLAGAARHFDAVLARQPDHADALHLRGLVAHRSGDPEAGLRWMDRAVQADPEHAPALANRSLPLRALGRLDEAAATLERALAVRPRFPQARVQAARVALARGALAEAARHADAALAERDLPEAHEILGQARLAAGAPSTAIAPLKRAAGAGRLGAVLLLADALVALGRLDAARATLDGLPSGLPPQARVAVAEALVRAGDPDGAIRRLRTVLANDRGMAVRLRLAALLRDTGRLDEALAVLDETAASGASLNLRATVLQQRGDIAGARRCLERAVALAPDDGAAWHNLGAARLREGDRPGAVQAHLAALEQDPDDLARWIGLAEAVERLPEPPATLRPWLVRGLGVEGLGHQSLERAARCLVEADAVVARALDGEPPTPVLADVLDDTLVHRWWRTTRVLGPRWERLLTALRRAWLLDDVLVGHRRLQVSLAIQAWHTGHAWHVEPDERAEVDRLDPHDPTTWVRRAAYRAPPAGLPRPDEADAEALHALAVRLPAEEARLARTLPTLALTDDTVSVAVRAQYEEHPYPRLLSVHRKPPVPLAHQLRQLFPWWSDPPAPARPRILIAGCGTGQQILASLTRTSGATALAVDLSRASLGVAARQVRAWGLQDRVDLVHGDLLALDRLTETFDVIECGGVLHHLADPEAGWAVLVDRLAPGGVMKVGLYAERARAGVVEARARVAGCGTDPEGLRTARRRLLDLPDDDPARSVVWSPDFPSLAGFRDLVLHACEHRFSLARLGAALDGLGLELLGFQHPEPRPAALYRARFPDDIEQRDLDRWEAIEADHPEIFAGMLQLWCRRRA